MKYKSAATAPHPRLVPLLVKYGLTHAQFIARGRPPRDAPPHLHDGRAAIVTELHESGLTWAELIEVTGLALPSIARLTRAKGCAAVRERRRETGAAVGRAWKGKARPGQLERQWAAGAFDAPETRAKYSQACARRIKEDPKFGHPYGRREEVRSPKGTPSEFTVRSSYETAAVRRFEEDPQILSFEYEPDLDLPNGRRILPDFLVREADGIVRLVEVKPAYALKNEATIERLRVAEDEARRRGWTFAIFTELELAPWIRKLPPPAPRPAGKNSAPPTPPGDSESVLSLLGGT